MPSLYVIRGRDQGKFFQVEHKATRIGRDPNNTIQLMDSEVSRAHAELRERQGRYDLVDLESSNGTLVNGEKVRQVALRSGDRIQIGQTLMIFTGTGMPETMTAAHSVDIIQHTQTPDFSRIVSSWAPSAPNVSPGLDLENPSEVESPPTPLPVEKRSLDVMYQTAIAVGRTMEIPELLERILRIVFDWVEADRGCIMLRDNQTGELRPAARCDREDGERNKGSDFSGTTADRISISRTILDFVMERREGVRTTDARDDSRWDAAQSIVQMGIREALCVPLLGRYDCVGAIYVDTYTSAGEAARRPRSSQFTDEHLRLLIAIGHQAALAIEDTFYYSSLLQSERLAAIGQTIAILSHHIKNILQGMRGGSYLIGAGLDRNDPEAIRRGWKTVERNQERISHLVLDMLSYSKDRQPDRVRGNLNETLADVVDLLQVRAGEQGCALNCVLDEAIPDCEFDPEGIHRAVLNLVTNALDAVAETESAEIAVRSSYTDIVGWTIEVDDNGPGIEAEDREKIFSLFESRKGNRGTGLGLPVSQKIVHEHGGSIRLVEKEGRGSCFQICLPPQTPPQPELADRETMS